MRSAIAGCLSDVRPSDVHILNVSALASSRRRLEFATEATNTVGIAVAYLLAVVSKYTQSSYQQQLTSASTTGVFTSQLTKFSSYYSTPGFKNATSLGVVVLTAAPSAAPSASALTPVQQPTTTSSSGSNNLGIYIGVGVAVVIILLILIIGTCYVVKKQRSAVVDVDNTAPTSITDVTISHREGILV